MRNPKPFWKEKSVKAVWARANSGAKIMCYAMLYVIVCAVFARFVSEASALWLFGTGCGFSIGWCVRDLMQPIEEKDNFEYQNIEFGDE